MISILDTTYREGKQSYLGYSLPASMVGFAKLLDKIGIRYMEVGYPFGSDIYLKEFRELLREDLKIQITVHSALNANNFGRLIKEGVNNIAVSLRFSDISEQIVDDKIIELKNIIDHCLKKYGASIRLRIGIEYAFKLPMVHLLRLCKKISEIENVERLSFCDTDGTSTPEIITTRLKALNEALPKKVQIEVHLHNDCGLASTNLYAAYELFRNGERDLTVDATVGGIGERNGIVSTGDILSLLYIFEKRALERDYSTKYYAELYRYIYVNQAFNRDPLNPMSFAHASGIHIKRFVESGTYQSIDPISFGQATIFIFNEFTSSDVVMIYSKRIFGVEMDRDLASKCASEVRNLSSKRKGNLTENELISIVKRLLKIDTK